MKLPNWKRTHEYIKRLANLDNITFGFIAHKFGKDTHTAEAWARTPESHENPNGNGKRNPLDAALRVIAMAHKEDAGLAREIAEIFADYCDFLDYQKGKAYADKHGCLNELCAESIKEHTDIVVKMMSSPNPDMHDLYTEILQSIAKQNELKECVGATIKSEIRGYEQFQSATVNGNHSRPN